jgi:hypothetical protein
MGDSSPQFPEGLPFLFFREDPDEQRLRIDGARPAPLSIPWPANALAPGQPADYPLLEFPWEPWSDGLETQSSARAYASWLNDVGPGRLALVLPLLAAAGAPVDPLRPEPGTLAELGAWIQDAVPVMAAPMIKQGFLTDDPGYRLGWAWRAHSPQSSGYSRQLDALVGSVTHDLALLVAACARLIRPGLAWRSLFNTRYRSFVIGLDPEQPQADLIEEIAEFVTQTAARPRGDKGRDLRAWYALTLSRGYERAVHGTAVPDVQAVFPDARQPRGLIGVRRSVGMPSRSDPPAAPELVTAMEQLRLAGWFEGAKRQTPVLASTARASWQAFEHEDIPLDPAQLFWRLLVLDSGRTWSDDIDAAIQPSDGIYAHLVDEISAIRGKALGRLWDASEHWDSDSGDLLLSLRMRAGKRQLTIPSPGRYISAALFTGLNELGPPDGPRLWFVDQGPPLGIVTRATAEERAALQDATGLRLDADPPSWWTALAPLPDRPEAAAPPQPAARPARTTPAGNSAAGKAAASHSRAGRGRAGPAAGRAKDPATAQAAFDRMMRGPVASAMHELGLTGTGGTRGFSYRSGDYDGGFWTQKSRYSTRDEVEFWVHLGGFHVPSRSLYWQTQLAGLIPGNSTRRWTVRADSPVEPVAQQLMSVFRHYGWPAILAAVDSPGYPPDPDMVWPRSFAPEPGAAARGADGPDLGPLTWPLRRTTERDRLLADAADPDERVRAGALSVLGQEDSGAGEVIAVLLNRLEQDPSPAVRHAAAAGLRTRAGQAEVRAAMLAAAAEDEDREVRWSARYAVRLADLAAPSGG